ncbi:hypothetical protein ACM66B_003785 [Microbotryomycetes sp. NB124-2]
MTSSRALTLSLPCLTDYSVWRRVKEPVLYFSLWALLVWALDRYNAMPMVSHGGSASLVGLLSMVTGLMVSFRSSSSYDRWYEGRKTWASLTSTCRSMLRVLAFALPPPDAAPSAQSQAMHELCRLVVAFCWATMYRLRDEPGVDHPELKELLPPSLLTAFARVPEISDGKVRHSSAPESARAVAALNTTAVPFVTRHHHLARIHVGAANLPLSLTRSIHSYLNTFYTTPLPSEGSPAKDTPALDAPTWSACMNHLNQLTDHLSTLERIRDTPIPLILSIQLQALLYIYVAAVPLQLVRTLHFWSIPATAIACAVFFGVDRAAEELSDPFGTEPNDLPIAKFCEQIHTEWKEIVDGCDWVPGPLKT